MANAPDILLVDDDERLRRPPARCSPPRAIASSAPPAGPRLWKSWGKMRVALVICDLRLPDLDGIALLKQSANGLPEAEVVMITGHGSIEQAVEAMRSGAYDFIEKPLDSAALLKIVAKALEKQRLASENRRLRRRLQQRFGHRGAHRRQPGDAVGQAAYPPDRAPRM